VYSIFFKRGDITGTEWLKRLLITTEGEGARLGQSGKQSSESAPKQRHLDHSKPKSDDRSWGVSKVHNPRHQIRINHWQWPSEDEKPFGSNSEYTVLWGSFVYLESNFLNLFPNKIGTGAIGAPKLTLEVGES